MIFSPTDTLFDRWTFHEMSFNSQEGCSRVVQRSKCFAIRYIIEQRLARCVTSSNTAFQCRRRQFSLLLSQQGVAVFSRARCSKGGAAGAPSLSRGKRPVGQRKDLWKCGASQPMFIVFVSNYLYPRLSICLCKSLRNCTQSFLFLFKFLIYLFLSLKVFLSSHLYQLSCKH